MKCDHCDCAIVREGYHTFDCFRTKGTHGKCLRDASTHRFISFNSDLIIPSKMEYVRYIAAKGHKFIKSQPIAALELHDLLAQGAGNYIWRGVLCPDCEAPNQNGPVRCFVLVHRCSVRGPERVAALSFLHLLAELPDSKPFHPYLAALEAVLIDRRDGLVQPLRDLGAELARSFEQGTLSHAAAILAIELANVFIDYDTRKDTRSTVAVKSFMNLLNATTKIRVPRPAVVRLMLSTNAAELILALSKVRAGHLHHRKKRTPAT